MAYIIVFKQHGALNCEQVFYGPFADYMAAENALSDGTVPCLYGQGGRAWPDGFRNREGELLRQDNGHRYVQELAEPRRPSFALRFPLLHASRRPCTRVSLTWISKA
jgi:hypothetical protein